MRSILLGVSLALATIAAAYADDLPYSDAFEVCREAAQTTRQTTDCIDREHERWDESLNTEYRNFLDALDEDPAEALREAQRAWIAWRDLECAFAASRYEGGHSRRSRPRFVCSTRRSGGPKRSKAIRTNKNGPATRRAVRFVYRRN